MTRAEADSRATLAVARAAVAVALTLVAIKAWALMATGALSVAASLADSALDVAVSLTAVLALAYAARPADEDHAFGHTSVEDLSALAQAAAITAAAVAIAWGAAGRLMDGRPEGIAMEGPGLVAMAVSALLTGALVLWQGRVVRATGSRVIAADRLHYLGDLIPTLGAMASLVASMVWGLWQVDSLVALVAAGVMLRGALTIGRGAWDALMDRRADPAILAGIGRIADGWPGVRGWHDLKTRTAGSRIFVVLHIELDGGQTLAEAHATGAALRRAIMDAYPRADVVIHKDVWQPVAAPGTSA
ncbi:MAG: cation diffusion facilitator family transporter [Gemmobacter sp.]